MGPSDPPGCRPSGVGRADHCDNGCDNRSALLELARERDVSDYGRFVVRRIFPRPTGLPNGNFEGMALAPESECSGGYKSAFWVEDGPSGGHATRRGSLKCGRDF